MMMVVRPLMSRGGTGKEKMLRILRRVCSGQRGKNTSALIVVQQRQLAEIKNTLLLNLDIVMTDRIGRQGTIFGHGQRLGTLPWSSLIQVVLVKITHLIGPWRLRGLLNGIGTREAIATNQNPVRTEMDKRMGFFRICWLCEYKFLFIIFGAVFAKHFSAFATTCGNTQT